MNLAKDFLKNSVVRRQGPVPRAGKADDDADKFGPAAVSQRIAAFAGIRGKSVSALQAGRNDPRRDCNSACRNR